MLLFLFFLMSLMLKLHITIFWLIANILDFDKVYPFFFCQTFINFHIMLSTCHFSCFCVRIQNMLANKDFSVIFKFSSNFLIQSNVELFNLLISDCTEITELKKMGEMLKMTEKSSFASRFWILGQKQEKWQVLSMIWKLMKVLTEKQRVYLVKNKDICD